ncbi:metal ABC transporter permease [Rubrivirga sp.]|uniref:metal ABC transporter permease n=1 Tax=Rubrivirga sp. TaxID=1885344 RepID=UPI003C790DED
MIELDYTLRTVALGAAVLGLSSGSLGSFAVLRGQSLLGDAISHAALPGVALAFLLTGSKAPLVLVVGAGLAGWVGTLAVMSVVGRSRVPYDAALGIVLSVFFGLGVVLLTFIQSRPDASQAGLDTFLFGQAAALVGRDVVTMAALGAVALLAMGVFWKEFKLLLFDPDFAAVQGFPARALDVGLTTLLVIAIVIGLQTVGVVLMSALIVAPAAAARQWTDRLWGVVVLAGVFGALSGAAGAVISSAGAGIPTGPTIVLVATAVVMLSLAFAPRRGLVAAWLRGRRNRRVLRVAGTLEDLYTLALGHQNPHHPHAAAALRTMTARPESVEPTLLALEAQGLVEPQSDAWALTARGLSEARRLARQSDLEDA